MFLFLFFVYGQELDETAVAEFRNKWDGMTDYIEKEANNIVEEVLAIGRGGEYDLVVVGKGRFPSKMVAELAEGHAEHPELGPIGDALASSAKGVACSVLVIQQHDLAHVEEVPVSKVAQTQREKSAASGDAESSSSTAKEISKDTV